MTATAKLTAALLTLIHRDVTHVIDHKEYAGSRKDDLVGNMVETFGNGRWPTCRAERRPG